MNFMLMPKKDQNRSNGLQSTASIYSQEKKKKRGAHEVPLKEDNIAKYEMT